MCSLRQRARAELELRRRLADRPELNPATYQEDPLGFASEVIGASLTEDVKRILLSIRDVQVTIAQSATDVGKTHGAAHAAVWFYKAFPESKVYTTAAPPAEQNLRRLLWGEIGKIVRSRPALFAGDALRTMQISPPMRRGVEPDHFVVGLTIPLSGTPEEREAKFSGKHAPDMLFIVDEGDAVPEEIYRGIEGCMSGGHARLLVLHNPRRKAGPVYVMQRDKLANVIELSAFDHPNVRTGEDVIPGAVSREATVRRVALWTDPLVEGEKPDNECFELPDFLAGCVATMPDGRVSEPLAPGWRRVRVPAFWYMVLGKYPPQAERQLISESWIAAARARYDVYVAHYGQRPPEGVRARCGLDVAEFGRDENCHASRYGGWVAPLLHWTGLDPDATAIRAATLHNELDAEATFVDALGIGAGVAPRMKRIDGEIAAHGVKVSEAPTEEVKEGFEIAGEFAQLRDQLYWRVREWLRTDPGAMLPPNERLVESLACPTYEQDDKGRLKVTKKKDMREMLGRSPEELDALALTFADEPERRWVEQEFLKY
jgi:hypothetical protein